MDRLEEFALVGMIAKQTMHINDLPMEILWKILSYLTVKEKFQCELVCHHWQRIIFTTIKSLTFEKFDDVFDGRHEHDITCEKPLPHDVNRNEETVNHIILKCGRYLRSFKGFVSYGTMQVIAQQCKRLHCADMLFDSIKSIKMLQDTFGEQLTCITLYTNFQTYIRPFLLSCSKLMSLAVIEPRFKVRVVRLRNSNSLLKAPALQQSFTSLKNLVVDCYITRKMLKRLALFTKLEMANIFLDEDLHQSALWRAVMTSWSSLKSLSLEVAPNNRVHFDLLPPNLEFLSLVTNGHLTFNYDDSKPIDFSTCLSKLKTLEIFQLQMTPTNLSTLLKSVIDCCRSLEELALGCYEGLDGNRDLDLLLEPLFSLTSMKKLTLASEFSISDAFAAKLITDLENLTSMGSFVKPESCDNLIPGGPMFWQALRHKAISRPSDRFTIVGYVGKTLCFQEPLPSNISLYVTDNARIRLSNGFGKSLQWQKLTAQWNRLTELYIEIHDTNLFLSGIPKAVEKLTIICIIGAKSEDRNALSFNTFLPNVEIFIIYQDVMTNQQLGITVKCIVQRCPKLQKVCIHRENVEHGSVDDYLVWVLKCKVLCHLCLTDKFDISAGFGSRLIQEVKTLNKFGCKLHLPGSYCNTSLLNTLAIEFAKKESNVKF